MDQVLKSFTLILIGLFFSISSFSQGKTLPINKVTKIYNDKNDPPLGMDIYYTESEEKRPLVIYLHGGGFMGGDKNDDPAISMCRKMAKEGFVAISMSYRLTLKGKSFGCDCPKETKIKTFAAACEDIWMGTKCAIKLAKKYNFDKRKIIITGSSAGAEAVLHAAYQVDTTKYKFRYAGVISMAGAIADTNSISKTSAIPALLFHGSCDHLVPYGSAPHHYCNENSPGALMLHGSRSIANRLTNLNVPNWLYTECGSGHGVAGSPIYRQSDLMVKFCRQIGEGTLKENYREVDKSNSKDCPYPQFECVD